MPPWELIPATLSPVAIHPPPQRPFELTRAQKPARKTVQFRTQALAGPLVAPMAIDLGDLSRRGSPSPGMPTLFQVGSSIPRPPLIRGRIRERDQAGEKQSGTYVKKGPLAAIRITFPSAKLANELARLLLLPSLTATHSFRTCKSKGRPAGARISCLSFLCAPALPPRVDYSEARDKPTSLRNPKAELVFRLGFPACLSLLSGPVVCR